MTSLAVDEAAFSASSTEAVSVLSLERVDYEMVSGITHSRDKLTFDPELPSGGAHAIIRRSSMIPAERLVVFIKSLVFSLASLTTTGFAEALTVAQHTDSSVSVDDATAPEVEIREIRPGVWVHTSWYTYPGGVRFPSNGLIVRTADDLLLVDTAWGEQRTRELLDRITSEIGLPLRSAIVTHSHYDRVAGVDVLKSRGIEVYAHPMTTKRTIGQGMPVPDNSVSAIDAAPGTIVQLGSVEVFYPGPGHAPDNLMVWVPSEAVLFAGCAVRSAASGSLGSISDADLGEWPSAIRRAQARYEEAAVVVPGHGEPGGAELLAHTLALLNAVRKDSP